MKKLLIAASLITLLAGCGSWQNNIGKLGADARTGDYVVTFYSGGQPVKTWELTNSYVSAGEEGGVWFFFDPNGKFVRISGDVLIEEK